MLKLYITLARQGEAVFLPEEHYWNHVFVHLMHLHEGFCFG